MRVNISNALSLLRAGELVGIPTETVYGLAADALNPTAVVKIFEAKNRPAFNPLICHLASADAVFGFGKANPLSERLAEFWPGPLTLLLKHENRIPSIVTSGSEYCAFRVPAHKTALELLASTGPLAAPSANKSGQVSPVRAEMVERAFGPDFPVIDGGPCEVGIESTICLAEKHGVRILRSGSITIEEIAGKGIPILEKQAENAAVLAPGQALSHYAPAVPLVLLEEHVPPAEPMNSLGETPNPAWASRWRDAGTDPARIAALDFHLPLPIDARIRFNLSEQGNLREAARNLFFYFDLPGASDIQMLVAATVPDQGIGRAINDRLRRAATHTGRIENGRLLILERA
ncbi:MAG: threonylcarbamoyl-AMP synthase [Leptospirales bacterium]|nr:threonylcarbamoyl-AMP synthase [Leptospirales bacterium]